jgi:hypothetical protein
VKHEFNDSSKLNFSSYSTVDSTLLRVYIWGLLQYRRVAIVTGHQGPLSATLHSILELIYVLNRQTLQASVLFAIQIAFKEKSVSVIRIMLC